MGEQHVWTTTRVGKQLVWIKHVWVNKCGRTIDKTQKLVHNKIGHIGSEPTWPENLILSHHLVTDEEEAVEISEVKASATNIMAPKSATKSMTSYKTFCMKRIKAVADAVKEYTGKTLASKQIEHLESICDHLRDQEEQMNQAHEQFLIDEHEELAAATII